MEGYGVVCDGAVNNHRARRRRRRRNNERRVINRQAVNLLVGKPAQRGPPTVVSAWPGWIVQSAPATANPLEEFVIFSSTARWPVLSPENICVNRYQPLVVIVTGTRHAFGGLEGPGHGFDGNVFARSAFVLLPITNAAVPAVGEEPALKT